MAFMSSHRQNTEPTDSFPIMSYIVAWQFVVTTQDEKLFEAVYGPDGDWVQLFRRDPRYIRTDLVRDAENLRRYLTLDHWESQQAYDDFSAKFAEEYKRIDARCEAFTESEKLIGKFVSVDSKPLKKP